MQSVSCRQRCERWLPLRQRAIAARYLPDKTERHWQHLGVLVNGDAEFVYRHRQFALAEQRVGQPIMDIAVVGGEPQGVTQRGFGGGAVALGFSDQSENQPPAVIVRRQFDGAGGSLAGAVEIRVTGEQFDFRQSRLKARRIRQVGGARQLPFSV